jgi:hypothetical protein
MDRLFSFVLTLIFRSEGGSRLFVAVDGLTKCVKKNRISNAQQLVKILLLSPSFLLLFSNEKVKQRIYNIKNSNLLVYKSENLLL